MVPRLSQTLLLASSLGAAVGGPEQIHLAYCAPAHACMVVSWASADNSSAKVSYGTSAGDLPNRAAGEATPYTFGDYTSPQLWHAELASLQSATTYYYKIDGDTEMHSFTTAPAPGPDKPFRFAVIGDLGQTKYSEETVGHIAAEPNLGAIIHAGDLSYADKYQPRWDTWGRMVQPLAARVPWMVTEGNHEVEADYGTTFVAYQHRFRMPAAASGAKEGNLYYSVDIGAVHWLFLGSYADVSASSPQYQWLQADLAAVDRGATPWIFAVLHAPWYNSNEAHQGDGWPMQYVMEEALYNANVSAVFAGHVHAYERVYPVYKGALDPRGPAYINVGDGGNREGLATSYVTPQPKWSAFRAAEYGHGMLSVLNSTHALWTWHRDDKKEHTVSDQYLFLNTRTAA